MAWWIPLAMAAVQMAGQARSGRAEKADAEFDARQREDAAKRARASGQRQSAEERRQARLVSSALQARAMGGGSDPGVVALDQGIAAEGEYRALAALYEGDMKAKGLEAQAAAARRTGKARADAYNWGMATTALQAYGSMYGGKYG